MTNLCVRCGGAGVVMSRRDFALMLAGECVNPEDVDCPRCGGSGDEPTPEGWQAGVAADPLYNQAPASRGGSRQDRYDVR